MQRLAPPFVRQRTSDLRVALDVPTLAAEPVFLTLNHDCLKSVRMNLKLISLTFAAIILCGAWASAATDPVEKEFIYKIASQSELKLVVTLPPDAAVGHKHAAIVFFSGGAWANSNVH